MLHHSIIKPNHMQIPWHDPIRDQKELPVSRAPLPIRAGVVGRVGLLLLSCGTGAWRVRSSMNELSEALGLVCAADIGLTSIEYTCSDGQDSFSQTLTLTATGVNTAKLDRLRCSSGSRPRSRAARSRSCSAADRSRCCWPFSVQASGNMCARG